MAVLIVLSLALLSIYFRESSGGPLHGLQSAGATVLRPFEVAASRVARPFRDAASWVSDAVHAKSENTKLRQEVDQLRQRQVQGQLALQENVQLRKLLTYRDSPRFPQNYRAVGASVISRPPSEFVQQVVVTVGSSSGVAMYSPVVTAEGLVGYVSHVTSELAVVTLLSDQVAAASGLDLNTGASGIVDHGQSSSLALDRVTPDQVVNIGDTIVTAGSRSKNPDLRDIYPKGIPIGTIRNYSQLDTDPFKHIQLQPFVDFGSLESVLVLIPDAGTAPAR